MNLWKVRFTFKWEQKRPFGITSLPKQQRTWFIITKAANIDSVTYELKQTLKDDDKDNVLLDIESAEWLGEISNNVQRVIDENKTVS